MTKRILSILIVLCMALTFVPFVGSAAEIIDGGYLVIDNNKAASGEGWVWENGVLTLSQNDNIAAVMASVRANVVLAGDVELGSAVILSDGGTITTGDYTLTVGGGINGANVVISDSNIVTRSTVMSSESLTITNSAINANGGRLSYAIGIYSDNLIVRNSVINADALATGDNTGNGIYAGRAYFENSVVVASGSGYGIVTMEEGDAPAARLQIVNSTVYANGGVSALAVNMSYTGSSDTSRLVLTDAAVTTPENATIESATVMADYSTASFAAVMDESGAVAKNAVIEAARADELPDYEVPETPEFPDTPSEPDEPTEPDEPSTPEIEAGVYVDYTDTTLIMSVVASNTCDRVALFYAEDTSLTACLITSSDYIEYEEYGLRMWGIEIDIPTEATDFVIKGRDEATQSYKNGIEYSFTITPPYVAPELLELYVGGVNAFETPEGDGWYFDEATSTLTLDNCTLTQSETFVNAYGEVINAVIYALGDLNIEFVGDNFIENRVEEIPTVATTYGAIWIDATYNDYKSDVLMIGGTESKLTVGLAVSEEVYATGLVEFSFAIFVFNDFGVDMMSLYGDSCIDVYGGVIGVPETYNVRPFANAPMYATGNKVTAYKDIEGTILDTNGYDTNDNEAWRVVIETSAAGVDKNGILNITDTTSAYGDGWTWENCVLTISEATFKAIWIELYEADVTLVITQDITIDSTATAEDAWAFCPSIYFAAYIGGLTIDTGDHTLTLINNFASSVDCSGDLTIKGNIVSDNSGNGDSVFTVHGDLVINNSEVFANNSGISVFDTYDYETGEEIGGNIIISDSNVYVYTAYVDAYGYETAYDAIYAYNSITIDNSTVYAEGTYSALNSTDIIIKNSDISVYGTYFGACAYNNFVIDNSTAMFDSSNVAVAATAMLCDELTTDAIKATNVRLAYPDGVTVAIAEAYDIYTGDFEACVFADADGNAVSSVYMEANNTATYEIINGKLIITVVTQSNINRVALYGEDGKCIKTFNTYEVDENGNYVWTIKMTAPTEETQYVIKGRDAATSSYKNGFTLPALTIEPEVVFEDVTVETRGDKVYVIATTVSDNYDRVAVVNPVDGSYVKYTRNYVYDYETGKYTWTIFFDYAEGMENLIVKARDIRTNHYNNAQAVEITVDEPVDAVIDVTFEEYDENRILVRVTTIPDLYRVKITSTDDLAGYIAYARNPVETNEDEWVWEMIIERPTEPTVYAFDVAYEKAYARYYYTFACNITK